MTEHNPPPPGWPSPARVAAIMEAIRRDIERYRAEFEKQEKGKDADGSRL